jgi:hypothetical protein
MRFLRLILVLFFCSAPASAADLSKIDRTIAKEPEYQSKPRYCLLVFGADAKTKVWLVLDGDVLYVDRNGNGDLTGGDKRVRTKKVEGPVPGNFVCGDVVPADGKTRYRRLTVSGSPEEGAMAVAIRVEGKHVQSAGVDANGVLMFADSPGRAPIVHFDGPLTMGLLPATECIRTATFVKEGNRTEVIRETTVRAILPKFERGVKDADLRVAVGTVGRGKGTFAAIHYSGLANGLCPVAEVEFPNRVPAKGAIKITLALRHRC